MSAAASSGTRDPHVATDDDGVRLDRGHQGPADLSCQSGGQFIRHDPTHVIGLEQCGRSLPVVSAQLVMVFVTGPSTPGLKVEA